MGKASSRAPELPESSVDLLARRLNRHRSWSRLLAVLPPLLFLGYAVATLFVLGWVDLGVLLFSLAVIAGVGFTAVLHFKTTLPPSEQVAKLIDERVDSREHFLTLATVDLSRVAPSVLARLRSQASRLLGRVNLERDFPYRMKAGSAFSLVVSLLSIVLLYFADQLSSVHDAAALKKVSAMAQQFSHESGLEAVALRARAGAGDLTRKLAGTDVVNRVVEQIKAQLGSGSQDGKQSGQTRAPGSTDAGGSGESNSQRAGTEPVPGGSEDQGDDGKAPGQGQDDLAKASNGDGDDRKPSQRGSKKGGKAAKSAGPGDRDDPGQKGNKDGSPKDQGSRQGRSGSVNPSEDVPQGKEPDRFLPPGQSTGGIKGGRFVTVALPKALSKSGGAGRLERRSASPSLIPSSNIPLAPRGGPEASDDRQNMPLEYEGLIE